MNFWRCYALVAVNMLDIPYTVLMPEIPTAASQIEGFYAVLALEILMNPEGPV